MRMCWLQNFDENKTRQDFPLPWEAQIAPEPFLLRSYRRTESPEMPMVMVTILGDGDGDGEDNDGDNGGDFGGDFGGDNGSYREPCPIHRSRSHDDVDEGDYAGNSYDNDDDDDNDGNDDDDDDGDD